MGISPTVLYATLAAATATTTAVSTTASQRQADAADKAKKLAGEADAQRALTEKNAKDAQNKLALDSLGSVEAKRRNQLNGATLPGALPQQGLGTMASPVPTNKTLIGA